MRLPRPNQKAAINFGYGLLIFVAYWAAAKAGLTLATINHHVSPVWPASGIAASALLLLGRKYWPFVWATAFFSNLFLGTPIYTVLIMSVGNTLEALVAEYCFRRIDESSGDKGIPIIGGLTASAVFAVPVAALIGTMSLASSSWGSATNFQFATNFFTWWTGDTIGLLLVVPVLLRAHAREYSTRSWSKAGELALYATLVAFLGYFTIWAQPDRTASIMILFPLLLIGVRRLGALETGLSIWLLVIISVFATFKARGPFYGNDFNTNLVQLQLFVGALVSTELALRYFNRFREAKSATMGLLVGWLITGLVFHSFNRKESEIDQARFHKLVSEANAKLAERMLLHETILRSAAGFLRSSKGFDDESWRTFVSELELQKFSGLWGVGHIVSVPTSNLDRWIADRQKHFKGTMRYSVFEDSGMKRVTTPVDEHMIVIAFEPRRKGDYPIAIDVSFESERREALLEARESGQIRISDQVPLQNMADSTGFVVVAPVYRSGKFETPEQRREAFIGWVHSPVLMSQMLEGVVGGEDPEVAMVAQLIGHDEKSEPTLYPVTLDDRDLNLRHEIHTELPLWGKNFRMTWYRTSHFQSRKDTTAAWIHFIGVVMTLLVTALMVVLENMFQQAQRIADQKTREIEMRDRLWTSLTRVVPAGIFQLDVYGKLIFTNEKWREYTKLDLVENPDACWISALDPMDQAPVRGHWADLQAGRTELIQVQCRVPASSKTFALSLRAVADEKSVISHFIGTLHDITEIHARQMQIMHSSRMASVGVMAAGMAHEINNPLAIIAGRTQLMMRHLEQAELPKQALQDSVTIIKQTVDRIARIVRGLRAFSRGGEMDSFLVASVPDIVQSTTEFCADRFKKNGVELRVKDVPAIELGCREVQISQVLLNLINNGFDAVVDLKEKWVEVEVLETPEEVQFCVTDSGRGINPEIADKIMIPFFTTKPVGQGTGLGLAISKGIAQDHCGDLVLDSKSMRTRFVFSVSKRLLEDGTVLAAL